MVDISMVSVLADEICEIHSVLSSRVGGVDSEARTVGGRWEVLCETSGESQGSSVELYQ